ncbi:hypothetical protein DPMN_106719 [Dreissena polymorpha]|uniref:Uncharacterized protein n=1 Tax=Dreissena polymorpha TaxID=45954 RepID=A0A9D4K5N5_DREPO|nr:hypothetical protein DPMN_106719 [Dreissena polymorpha]
MINFPPPSGHVFHTTGTIFKLSKTRVFTNFFPDGHVFQATETIFELIQYTNGTNLLPKFHDDGTTHVASEVSTRKYLPPLCGHVFQQTRTIFKLIQDIIRKNILTKYHDDLTINVTLRVKNAPSPVPNGAITRQRINVASRVLTRRNAPPKTNLLTKFRDDRTIHVANKIVLTRLTRKNSPPTGGHVIQPTITIFKQIQDIIEQYLLNKLQKDRKINVASKVLTRKDDRPHIIKTNVLTKCNEEWTINLIFRNASPPLRPNIVGTNLLIKFHEDRTTNVVSRVLTKQMLTPHNARRTTDKRRSQKLTMSTLCPVIAATYIATETLKT